MVRDEVIREALEQTNWDLLACSMPSNVLLLTGYWPAAGYAMALATRDGQILLLVPHDELDLAERSWADEVVPYCPVSLDRLLTAEEPVVEAFAKLKEQLGILADRIGIEQAESFEPPGFAPNLFRGSAARIMRRSFPSATLAPADELLAAMRAVKTAAEIEHIRTACHIAETAFVQGAAQLRPGATEAEIAAVFRIGLTSCLADHEGVTRCDGFTYCMSGPNSALAWGLYSRSRARLIANGDLVVLRCHSYADGYWADITRTYHLATPDSLKRKMFEAVWDARDAVLDAIRPGIRSGDLDRIARQRIDSHGLAAFIRHPTGHGAGFGALDHTARPRLHCMSADVLEDGMILTIEPGIYVEGHGGVRQSDMVAVTPNGANVLTNFHWTSDEVTLNG
jgi:Xaa-Pro aminopeptidase